MAEFFAVFNGLHIVDIVMLAVCIGGAVILANWFMLYSGPAALANSRARRNSLPLAVPLVCISVWLVLTLFLSSVITEKSQQLPNWQREFYVFLAMAVFELVMIGVFLYFGRHCFARRLKGFGLNWRNAGRDFGAAMLNLIAVLPLVMLGVLAVSWVGERIVGPNFQMQTNEGLVVITDNPQIALRVLLILFVVVVTPVFEEMLFRGLLQSMIRGYVVKPWPAIMMASVIFAMLHPQMHWPALLALSACMGYAYEKSGSLIRPIFIHAMFNAMMVTAALVS